MSHKSTHIPAIIQEWLVLQFIKVLVQVHERDRYGHLRGVFACIGPATGPIQAPAKSIGKASKWPESRLVES